MPTNPASVFVFGISSPKGLPAAPSLTFGPAVAGRSYFLQSSSNLLTGTWSPLAATISSQTNSSQIVVPDPTPSPPQKFYRVRIALP